MSLQWSLATETRAWEPASSGFMPLETRSEFIISHICFSASLSTLTLLVLKLRLTDSFPLGSTVKKDNVSFTAPPNTLLIVAAKCWVFEVRTFAILDEDMDFFITGETGRVTIIVNRNDASKSPDKTDMEAPKALSIVLVKSRLTKTLESTCRIKLLKIKFEKTCAEKAATKKPIAVANPWGIAKEE